MQSSVSTLRLTRITAFLATIFAGLANVAALANDDIVEPVDPAKIARQFADDLAELLGEGRPVDLDRVRDQLPDEQTCSICALPSSGQAIDPRELYTTCRESIVLVGRIYKCDKCHKWHTNVATGSSGSPVLDGTGAVVGIVRSTTPVYYEKKDGVDTKIQMVMKYCIPSTSLLKLLGQSTKDEKASP